KAGGQRTLVFDEIDTGIGGRAAEAVGKKLKSLARANQVLCITHLPQIASFADHHYLIEKRETAGRTKTLVRALTAAEQTEEIARMLSGEKLTETSRPHAEQLLKANGSAPQISQIGTDQKSKHGDTEARRKIGDRKRGTYRGVAPMNENRI
ncbi:MAG TPA: hypothetical protein VFT65_17540, partial [Candidatus Angelobacter sp.]|nr:hypothetical protein [Candidatus Angelobacter sp.]